MSTYDLEKVAKIQRMASTLSISLANDAGLMKTAGWWDNTKKFFSDTGSWIKKNPWKALGHGALTAASFLPVTAPFAWGGRALMGANALRNANNAKRVYDASRVINSGSKINKARQATAAANYTKNTERATRMLRGPQFKPMTRNPLTWPGGVTKRTANMMTAPGGFMPRAGTWGRMSTGKRMLTTGGVGVGVAGNAYMANQLRPSNVKGNWNFATGTTRALDQARRPNAYMSGQPTPVVNQTSASGMSTLPKPNSTPSGGRRGTVGYQDIFRRSNVAPTSYPPSIRGRSKPLNTGTTPRTRGGVVVPPTPSRRGRGATIGISGSNRGR